MLDQPIAFVDLETTGADPVHDRVIEIGIVRIAGCEVDYEWQTLVDPEQPIPAAIQGFTGITDDMVRGAPTFADVAEELAQRIEGALFAAHNARFDAGFLRNELRRLGRPFQPRVMCTVRLSRALYPQYHRHGLDAIIARHGLACAARHRALGDARVLWDFVQLIRREHLPDAIDKAMAKAMKHPSLPPQLPADALDQVPDAPGVYMFYGENDLPLYIGRSANLRAGIQSHFAGDHDAGRALRISQEIRRIDWIEAAGELGALLLAARLLKEKLPIHNRRLRRHDDELCSYVLQPDETTGCAVKLVLVRDVEPGDLRSLHGLFRSKREAVSTLRQFAVAHELCPKRLGLEMGAGPCSAHQLGKCRGACIDRERAAAHDLRLRVALASLRLKTWPFKGPIAVREANPERGRETFHVFDAWCYLGTGPTPAGLFEAAQGRHEPLFELDIYKLLTRFLARRPPGIVELDASAHAT